jgi:hypothetical protein
LRHIAAKAANALPRYRFRQYLNHRTCLIHEIKIDHAIPALRHGIAGFDPDRRSGQRQRRIGRRADEIARAQGPAVPGCDIGRRKRHRWRHIGGDAAECLRERQRKRRQRLEPIQHGGKRYLERRQRSRQALGWDHQGLLSSPDRAAHMLIR